MSESQACSPIIASRRVLGVSTSGDHAWRRRCASDRDEMDEELLDHIRAIHTRSRGTYGALRIQAELRAAGTRVGRERAIAQRRPGDVIHHSDQGCLYTSIAFGNRCREAGVRPSNGSVGDCYDNALAESFFATLEWEPLDRRHSGLGYLSPIDFERMMSAA